MESSVEFYTYRYIQIKQGAYVVLVASLPTCLRVIGLIRASGFLVFARLIERWASETLFALTTMTACSQRVELRAA